MQQITKDLVKSEEIKCHDDSITTLSDNDQSDNYDSEDDEAFLARFVEAKIALGSDRSQGTVLLPPVELVKESTDLSMVE